MPTTAEILNAAADLLATPGAWTQRQPARDINGIGVFPSDPDAVCWCMVGAVQRAVGVRTLHGGDAVNLVNGALRQIEQITGSLPPVWNDAPRRTRAEVVAALRQAAQSVPA